MKKEPKLKGLGPVYLSVFIDVMGIGLIIPVLPFLILELAPDNAASWVGATISVYAPRAPPMHDALAGCCPVSRIGSSPSDGTAVMPATKTSNPHGPAASSCTGFVAQLGAR